MLRSCSSYQVDSPPLPATTSSPGSSPITTVQACRRAQYKAQLVASTSSSSSSGKSVTPTLAQFPPQAPIRIWAFFSAASAFHQTPVQGFHGGKLTFELLDAIIGTLDDVEALKVCALTGSLMRGSSQRILLRSLTLTGYRDRLRVPNYQGVDTLLRESPHIAAYITHLIIHLPLDSRVGELNTEEQEVEILQQVLGKLARFSRTGDITRLLTGPHLLPYTAAMHGHSILAHCGPDNKMVFAVALTLEHVEIMCGVVRRRLALRSAEFALEIGNHTPLSTAICTLLQSTISPDSLRSSSRTPAPRGGRGPCPRLSLVPWRHWSVPWWRLDPLGDRRAASLVEFAMVVLGGMPRAA
ncbi:hypothetical protein B0H17DRAFT_1202809 [Mycena rosella]|uniref:Uncharacterized protein n=1 Tax=Mycena rosella TaxID=1033263 RepID=A0AAD7DF26_MYCRO|nr:hypothetical protein B0H17DRAFT_1202809 [Mycena rosella]